ncbi:MAG: sigma-70 family RNA polymerase sigma factor [Candidatus Aminicenantales bacterium]
MAIDRSDEELMLRYRNGDKTAFETLYGRYEKSLFDFIYRMVPDSTETETLFQETFLRLVRARRRYRPSAQFKTWLFQIAVNLCRDRLRGMKHRSHLSLNSPLAAQGDSRSELQDVLSDPSPAVDKSVEDGELQSAVQGALSSLPEDEQLVVVLREYQGMKYSEIAEVMDRPVGTLKSINHRAHERLRHALARYLGE